MLHPSAVAVPSETWIGAAFCLGLMAVLYGVHRRQRNAGVVDFGWAVCLGGLGVFYAFVGVGDPARRVVLAVLVGVWSLRLAIHLARRGVFGTSEEGRYERLRAWFGARADAWFLAVFLGQAALDVLLAIPFWMAANTDAPFGPFDIAAVMLWVGAFVGESIADRQLAAFVAQPENRGRTCRDGLWGWSRHPNYFFEWLMWCAYALLAMPAPHGAIGWIAPALMLVLILKVTGIPPTEAQALRSRGDDYRAYQRTTSAFVPLPPRREATT